MTLNKMQEDGLIGVHGRQVKIPVMKRRSAMPHITPDKTVPMPDSIHGPRSNIASVLFIQ
ncbi:MAG: hypothetical protein ACREPB_07190 [Arenimonas sp.]